MTRALSTHVKRVVVAAAVAAASSAVCGQPALPFATTAAQTALVEQIAQLRAEGGPNAAAAIDPLRALALQYQETGDDALAIGILEEARHVTRVHRGLTSPDEALLLRDQIRSEKALGAHQRVWDFEQDMVTIARQHHDDIRMAPIFGELAEDRVDALRQYRGGHFPPEIYLGCYYVSVSRPYNDTRGDFVSPPGSGSCRSGNKLTVYRQLRTEILMYYADAIEVIVKNGDFASQELRRLEQAAVRFWRFPASPINGPIETGVPVATVNGCERRPLEQMLASDLVGTCLEPVMRENGSVAPNVGGWVGHVRLIAYEMRSGAPAADRARAIVELADWQLLATPAERRRFDKGDEAVELYERAYRELQQGADVPAAATQLFAPEVPVTLPTSEPNPFAALEESQRYIDVAFAITQYGQGKQIEILDTSEGATRAEVRDLTRLIELSSFRPRMVDGVLAIAAPVTIRYRLPAQSAPR
jgi:hypothetical protein